MTAITVNALLQQLRAEGMQPRVVYAEKGDAVLRDERAAWEHEAIRCPYDPAEYVAETKVPRAQGWK
jgi:hypothetical protein